MAGEAGQGATPTPADATSAATEEPKPNDDGAKPSEGAEQGDDATLAEAGRKAIQREREKAKAAEERAKAAEERIKAIEEKDLPAAEKAARRVAELEEENKRLASELVLRDVSAEVAKAATKIGVIDTDVVMVLLRENDSIDFDADGKPVNVEAAIKDLVKQKPYLARPTAAGADAGAGTRPGAAPGQGMNDIIRRAAGRTG